MNRPNLSICSLVFSLLTYLLFNTSALSVAAAHPRNEVDFYVQTYGAIQPVYDTQVKITHQVFKQVRAVADKNSKRLPRLVVVNSDNDPWAIALPDGHIVLSKQAVKICYNQISRAEACLAFVLGHELAHLANDDFWHQEVHSFLATTPHKKLIDKFVGQHRHVKESELAADDKGYIYAAMAGYPVDSLLKKHSGELDFFNYWMQQTNASFTTDTNKARTRTAMLRQRLHDIQNKLVYFEFGVRLSHFDYCDDAVYFLKEFLRSFPGREVLNNLGYCYLQMARQAMAPARAYFYWMPLQLDGITRAAALISRGAESFKSLKQAATAKTEDVLQQAIEYLEQATKADPAYVPARINLAVAHLYLGRPHQARAVLDEARRLAPERFDVQGLEALTIYEQSDDETDLLPIAIRKLERLAARSNASSVYKYNLARLLELHSHQAEALSHWNHLAHSPDSLPVTIRHIVCSEQSMTSQQDCEDNEKNSPANSPWRWPVEVAGLERLSSATIQNYLKGWTKKKFDWIKDHLHGHIYQRPDGTASVLEFDQFVQMQVLKGGQLATIDELAKYCGKTLTQRLIPQGVVSSCEDWAVLALDGKIREVWWIAKLRN